MMKRQGIVIGTKGMKAKVALIQAEQCDCGGTQGEGCCLGRRRTLFFEVDNIYRLTPGDIVEITLPSKGVLITAFLVYVMPILMAVIGYTMGEGWTGKEGIGVGMAMAGLVGSFLLLKPLGDVLAKRSILRSRITGIVRRQELAYSSSSPLPYASSRDNEEGPSPQEKTTRS